MTVVVPTYRRPESLGRCLAALQRQNTPADEILVVVRPQDEESKRVVERLGYARMVPVERSGVVAALNAGVAASTGDVVAMTDDDTEPHPDWIERLLKTYASDPRIAAVGGRDRIHHAGPPGAGTARVVGVVGPFGRITGNHHAGTGPPRDVDILKGANLSARGDLARHVRFDERLRGRGTEHHSEVGFCLKLRRMGYRIVYDPNIAVDHHPEPRVDDSRKFGAHQVRDSSHNETLALLEYLPARGRVAHILWTTAIGTRGAPGFAQSARLLITTGDPKLRLLYGNLTGRALAVLAYLRTSRHKAHIGGRARGSTAGPPETPSVLAMAHSPGAAVRAEQLLSALPDSQIARPSSDATGMASAAWLVLRSHARVLYLIDIGRTTAPAAVLGRLMGKRVILDTGDACYELARSLGERSSAGLLVVWAAEQLALRSAHEVVVRGRAHAAYIPGHTTHIPDIPPPGVGPTSASEMRRSLGLDEGSFVVGLVGSLIFSRRLRISYGWDLIEALPHTGPEVVALIVGDGSGLDALRRRAGELGVSKRCRFVGQVPTERICEYIGAMDVALSTQTNDIVGEVRTTGKLPLYLACGCPVLASHVGEAARILGPLGWTVPYQGTVDPDYPPRLAAAIERWRGDRQGAAARHALARQVAQAEFDTVVMRERLRRLIQSKPTPSPIV
jgi:glycosyltransferase involved in cell wall biosynthesis